MASNKFEEMLEKLVNEDKAGAEELFHEIVVEKSRDIYEGLLESDLEVDETKDEAPSKGSEENISLEGNDFFALQDKVIEKVLSGDKI